MQIANPHLLRAVLQRVPRGAHPGRTITAPEPMPKVDAMLTERERLAQFEHSKAFSARPVPRHLSLVPIHA